MLLVKKFIHNCKELQLSQEVIIGYSGGLDSVVLLDLCVHSRVFTKVTAVHINHGLHKDANTWQQHCADTCYSMNVQFKSFSANISGNSIETQARDARRQIWRKIITPNCYLLLAHHQNDQVETILFRLIRGTGLNGLSAMQHKVAFANSYIIRPMLDFSREQILDYAQQRNLIWVEDSSNQDCCFDRNFLRNKVLPLITMRWPHAVTSIARSGKLCGMAMDHISQQVTTELTKITSDNFDIQMWQTYPSYLQTELLRKWIFDNTRAYPSHDELQRIVTEIIDAKVDARPMIRLSGVYITRYRTKLYCIDKIAIPEIKSLVWDLRKDLAVPQGVLKNQAIKGKGLLVNGPLLVRTGEHGKSAKKIFQQYAIPPWERGNYVTIYSGQRLICIVDLWYNSRIKVNRGQIGYIFSIKSS